MSREAIIWVVIMVIGAAVLIYNGAVRGAGRVYVKAQDREFLNVGTEDAPDWIQANSPDALDYDLDALSAGQSVRWTEYDSAQYKDYLSAVNDDPNQTTFSVSWSRTIGVWVAAFFTLAIMSFLYKDNPFYKFAEAVIVGVSAAYWMVVGFHDTIAPILLANLWPDLVRSTFQPNLPEEAAFTWKYLIPLVLSVMLIWRLSPKGGWIARWPMAFIIGAFCGLRLVAFLYADFLSQINNSIIPLYVTTVGADGASHFDFWASVKAVTLIVGILTCLVYFFFSFEHKGIVGKTARVGIWFLMITFGAAFGYTVMGRIALLAARIEFLVDDWLWLIDPSNNRLVVDATAMLGLF